MPRSIRNSLRSEKEIVVGVLQQYNKCGQPLGLTPCGWSPGVGKSPRLTGAVKAAVDEGKSTGGVNLRLKVPLHEAFHVG